MKLIKKSFVWLFVSFAFFSCTKESNNIGIESMDNNVDLIDGWYTEEYFSGYAKGIKMKESEKSYGLVAWGIGYNNRVFKTVDQGQSWQEPNPSAKLRDVSIGNGPNAWGIGIYGSNGKIWKWNGSSWYEPNLGASGLQISAIDNDNAWLVTSYGTVYVTQNGGAHWSPVNTSNVGYIKEISAGSFNNIWGLTIFNQIVYYSNNSFNVIPYNTLVGNTGDHISASNLDGDAWITKNNHIYKYNGISGTWSEPSPTATGNDVSTFDGITYVLGSPIGSAKRIFKTTPSLLPSYIEPNTSAGLNKISSGFDSVN